ELLEGVEVLELNRDDVVGVNDLNRGLNAVLGVAGAVDGALVENEGPLAGQHHDIVGRDAAGDQPRRIRLDAALDNDVGPNRLHVGAGVDDDRAWPAPATFDTEHVGEQTGVHRRSPG